MKNFFKNNFFLFLTITLVTIVMLPQFFKQGIYPTDDADVHLAKMAAFELSFKNGHLIPRWSNFLGNGYGGPYLLLSYLSIYFIQLPMRMMGFSLIDSFKIISSLIFIGAGLFFYLFFQNEKCRYCGFIAVCLLIFSPFWINNIYVRGSLGENAAILGLAFTLFFLKLFWRKPNFLHFFGLTFGWSFICLSHIISLVVFLPFIIIYIAFQFYERKNYKILFLIFLSVFLAFLLTAFNLIPLVFEIKYTHYASSKFNGNDFFTHFLKFPNLLLPDWTLLRSENQYPHIFGVAHWLIFIIGILILLVKRKNIRGFYLPMGIIIILTGVFLNSEISWFIYQLFPIIKRIQFPWRFIDIAVIGSPYVYIGLENVLTKKKKIFALLSFILFIFLLYPFLFFVLNKIVKVNFQKAYETPVCQAQKMLGREVNTNGEYCLYYQVVNAPDWINTLPVWAIEPQWYPKISDKVEIIEGLGTINKNMISDTRQIYDLNLKTKSKIIFRSLYFPGWVAEMDGKKIPIQFQDTNYPGLILVEIPRGHHKLEFRFEKTKIRFFSDIISLTAFILIVILIGYFSLKNVMIRFIKNNINKI